MKSEWFAPHWLEVTSGREIDWRDDESRLELLANILLHQRRVSPRYTLGPNVTAVEIISDGISKKEPRWHGLNHRCEMFQGVEYDSLKKRVSSLREAIGSHFKTHFAIAELFYRPVLLNVHKQPGEEVKCYVHRGMVWEPLASANNLPLKINRDRTSRAQAHDVAYDLSQLHEAVLWPAFFTHEGSKIPRQSLVLLHASSYRVLGVWALHAQGESLVEPSEHDPFKLLEDVFLSMTSINDVFGAIVEAIGSP